RCPSPHSFRPRRCRSISSRFRSTSPSCPWRRSPASSPAASESEEGIVIHRSLREASALVVIALVLFALGCAPQATRGGTGTARPEMDEPALGVGLDREDINYLVAQNLASLEASKFWLGEIVPAKPPPL